MSSAVPLMASFEELQRPSLGEPRLQPDGGGVRRRPEAASAAGASSEAGRKGLEDIGIGKDQSVSMAEVSKHQRQGDAWVVVDGVVYDVSHFVDTHPGGVEVGTFSPLLMLCFQSPHLEVMFI